MKFASAFVLFLLPRAAVGGLHRDIVTSRGLQVSAECLAETEDLFEENPDLEAARNTTLAEIEQVLSNASLEDLCTLSGNTATCRFDFDSLSTVQDYKDACSAASDGQLITTSISARCSGSIAGQNIKFGFEFEDVADCVSKVCDPDKVDEEINILFQELGNKLETELGIECEVGSSASTFGAIMSIIVMTVATLLFAW